MMPSSSQVSMKMPTASGVLGDVLYQFGDREQDVVDNSVEENRKQYGVGVVASGDQRPSPARSDTGDP